MRQAIKCDCGSVSLSAMTEKTEHFTLKAYLITLLSSYLPINILLDFSKISIK